MSTLLIVLLLLVSWAAAAGDQPEKPLLTEAGRHTPHPWRSGVHVVRAAIDAPNGKMPG